MTWSATGIGFIAILMFAAGIAAIVLIVSALVKGPKKSNVGLIATIFGGVFAAALLASLLLPTHLSYERQSSANAEAIVIDRSLQIVPEPSSQSAAEDRSGQSAHQSDNVSADHGGVRHTEIHYGTNSRSRFPRMLLVAIGLAALLALARVAVDGRKGIGYGAPARIIAVLAFAGICAMLAKLGPILH